MLPRTGYSVSPFGGTGLDDWKRGSINGSFLALKSSQPLELLLTLRGSEEAGALRGRNLSEDQTGYGREGQSLDMNGEMDEASIPTTPMRAISVASPAAPNSRPSLLDDDEDGPTSPSIDLVREGSKDNPFRQTDHQISEVSPETKARIQAIQAQRGPQMTKVVGRVVGLLLVLGAVVLGILKFLF
jgi:hypothetical protein